MSLVFIVTPLHSLLLLVRYIVDKCAKVLGDTLLELSSILIHTICLKNLLLQSLLKLIYMEWTVSINRNFILTLGW